MNLFLRLRNIYIKMNSDNTMFTDVKKQKKVLDSFPEPKDLYERSYYQYKCQMALKDNILVFIQNIVATVLLPFYYIKLRFGNKAFGLHYEITNGAIFMTYGIASDTIPSCLYEEYGNIFTCKLGEECYIGLYEKKILRTLFRRYWYSPHFLFKCMLRIGMYAAKIEYYKPRAVISYSEFSFISSVLTEYCHLRGVEHINIMHGEKLFSIRDTFVKYDRYYVWDEHYVSLLKDLRADKGQFRIAVPSSVKCDVKKEEDAVYEYTYYLGGEKTEELLRIRDVLVETDVPKLKLCIRFHPRYSRQNEIERLFMGFNIENPADVPLDVSFARTRHAVSLYSTILYQAFECGKDIVIDDVTNTMKYNKLKELRYIMLNKPHQVLSNYLIGKEKNVLLNKDTLN